MCVYRGVVLTGNRNPWHNVWFGVSLRLIFYVLDWYCCGGQVSTRQGCNGLSGSTYLRTRWDQVLHTPLYLQGVYWFDNNILMCNNSRNTQTNLFWPDILNRILKKSYSISPTTFNHFAHASLRRLASNIFQYCIENTTPFPFILYPFRRRPWPTCHR